MENKENNNSMLIGGLVFLLVIVVVAVGAFIVLTAEDDTDTDTDEGEDTVVENNDTPETADPTLDIVETAQATETLSTLVEAVVAADLAEALGDDSAEYTVFAPINSAFADIQSTVDTLLAPENVEDLTNVLQFHVVPTAVLSSEIEDGTVVETLAGDTLKLREVDGEVYINDAMVVTADVETTNGVVHIIDKVLVPGEFGNVVETAQNTEVLSSLVDSVVAAGLVDALSAADAEYTVFAPVNDAFADISDVTADLSTEELADVLQYHVVDSEVFSSELVDGQEIITLNGATLTVEIRENGVYIVGANSEALVTTPDVFTSNGVVHVIDTVLLP